MGFLYWALVVFLLDWFIVQYEKVTLSREMFASAWKKIRVAEGFMTFKKRL